MDLPVASSPAESDAPHLSHTEARDLKDPSLYINRELGWLDFNRRVLAQAADPSHPLLERIKFLGITAGNLDEFFMIRMANALRKVRNGIEERPPDGLSAAAQLAAMRDGAYRMMDDQAATWATLRLLLERENIVFLDTHDWEPQVRTYLGTYFAREVFPALTPLAFDPGHPFPFISNLSTNLAVAVEQSGRMKFARVKVPPSLPRFVELPPALAREGTSTFVFLEDVIKANVQELFPGLSVKDAHLFRIVRDSDLEIDDKDDADDLLETVDRSLRRLRHGALSLLQVEADMPERTLDILVDNFETTSDIVVRTTDRLGLRDWIRMANLPRPDLKFPPLLAPRLWRDREDPEAVFDLIRYQDVVLHHPFESFGTVETFLRAAVRDPLVIAIKMTLYRIGPQSPLVPLLIEAAEAGKQVAVLVELKARLDERNNIIWARQLESHGIHVSYGFPNLKTHLKLCLVVRQGQNGVRQFVHTSTGNYNPTTAKIYTDIGIITSDPDIVADVADVFNMLTGYRTRTSTAASSWRRRRCASACSS